jgi:hypothetical protein
MFNNTKKGYPDKVKITTGLLLQTVSLLEELEIEDYPPEIVQLYGYVFYSFKNKKGSLDNCDNYQYLCCNSMSCGENVPF